MTDLKGGCLCGRVRYTLKGAPMATTVCHCTHCQKVSGSAFSVNLVVRKDQVVFDGHMGSYRDTAESGNILHRRFCSNCGSSLASEPEARPGVLVLKAGTLDSHDQVRPTAQIWVRSAQPWVKFAEPLETFEKGR